eukprot:TRINITY_DN11075_c0_g1_i1.p1 TRINITY_DN11075_c0_g1~~TRINITY_DN11075_c0_g1_i1.p1  ORF type:complete len:100 (+),score=10.20 TRINITY_DN11075_c0_g1_i1:207-506(+)
MSKINRVTVREQETLSFAEALKLSKEEQRAYLKSKKGLTTTKPATIVKRHSRPIRRKDENQCKRCSRIIEEEEIPDKHADRNLCKKCLVSYIIRHSVSL